MVIAWSKPASVLTIGIAAGAAARSLWLLPLDAGWTLGLLIAAALVAGVVLRSGASRPWAALAAATFLASLPHADLDKTALLGTLGVLLGLLARGGPRVVLVGLGVGILVVHAVGDARTLAVAPWRCPPRRLGTAIPLSFGAIGAFGMSIAALPAHDEPTGWRTLVERTGPLVVGLAVVAAGTYHPPRPPLYNLPSGVAMGALGAVVTGLVLATARGRRSCLDEWLAIGLGGTTLALTALRTEGWGPGPPCGQVLAPLLGLALLSLAVPLLARPLVVRRPSTAPIVEVAGLAQLAWMTGFGVAP